MPKSKRNKQIELSKTKKRGLEWKKGLFEEVRKCVDTYTNVFVFSVNDMRNSKMKNVREQWKHSRFFIGKNKIMAMALGRSAEEEYKPNLHKIGQEIKGERSLLFSNKSTEEVLNWFRSYSEGDYARSGNVASEDVKLSTGPLPMFPHNLEPYLRQLGLPTSLVKGEIHLIKDHEVCKAGDTLTPESAKILKLLGYEMAEFHITIECVWSHDGTYMKFTESVETDSKENAKKEKKKSPKKKKVINESAAEDMEMDLDKNVEELNNNLEDLKNEFSEDCNVQDVVSQNAVSDITDSPEAKTDLIEVEDKNEVIEVEDKTEVIEVEDKTEVVEVEDSGIEEITAADETQKSEVLAEDKPSTVGGRPVIKSNRKSKVIKRDSLPKTPDANTSQDSPVFRQLRNRSVKVSRKKK